MKYTNNLLITEFNTGKENTYTKFKDDNTLQGREVVNWNQTITSGIATENSNNASLLQFLVDSPEK